MDAERFDGLARRLAAAGTRRGALGLLAGGVLGLALGVEPAEARRRCRRLGRTCTRSRQCCGRLDCNSNGNPLVGRVCCSQNGGRCLDGDDCCGRLFCNPASNTCT